MNLYVSLRNSSHGLLSANNVLFLESVQLINLTHDGFLLSCLVLLWNAKLSFFKNLFGKEAIFEELRKPIKKEGALDFKVFRSFVIFHFNYLKELLIVKRCASLVSLYSLAPTRRMGEFKTVMQILNDFV